jgi:hypothetical protein
VKFETSPVYPFQFVIGFKWEYTNRKLILGKLNYKFKIIKRQGNACRNHPVDDFSIKPESRAGKLCLAPTPIYT